MSEEITETWTTRELPILRAALHHVDVDGDMYPNLEDLRDELGIDDTQMQIAAHALHADGYIEIDGEGMGVGVTGYISRIHAKTRRELGSWPSADALLENLITALNAAAADEAEPEKKNRLRAAADVLSGMARDVAVAAISKQIG